MAFDKENRAAVTSPNDLDMRALGRALKRRSLLIFGLTFVVAAATAAGVNLLTPRYKSEARILYDGRENIFLRPEAEKSNTDRAAADQEAMTSQVQLVLSRELALEVIGKLKLNELPEFDPVLSGMSTLKHLFVLGGISRDPFRMTPLERVLESYYERLTAFAVDKSRVITVEFQSYDPEVAARVTNAIADGYLGLQQSTKQEQTRAASQWLAGEIESLRRKVAEAEARAEDFRAQGNLLVGTNNTTLSNQQLGEFNTQLGAARGLKADAETRARLIRDMLKRGDQIEASEVVNSELIRRLSEQRVTLRAQLAEQSSTLLDAHPRIKELKAQIADLDRQIRGEAEKLVRMLENDARIAGARVDALSSNLESLKRQAATTNEQDVQLRALEREAKAQRELLESYLAKYREAAARESIGSAPADARVISRATASNTPYFPKKLPIVLVATLATLVMSAGFVMTGELLRANNAYAWPAADIEISAPDHIAPGAPITRLDELARKLRTAGDRRIALFGSSRDIGPSHEAIALARALAGDSRVIVVDLSETAPAVPNVGEMRQPGVAEIVRATASFGEIITRDKLSRVHLVAAGDVKGELSRILSSPRLAMLIDALAHTYDHVLVHAGVVLDVPVDLVVRLAPKAVLVAKEAEQARGMQALFAAGYHDVTVFTGAPSARSQDRPAAA
jgi:uncharacterized protein involved in exopolysaccharide biosynthesis